MEKLNKEQINQKMAYLMPYWNIEKSKLVRKFVFDDFNKTMNFVNKIAKIADKLNHHPDIYVENQNHLTIKISTHSLKKLSKKDFELTLKIDEIRP